MDQATLGFDRRRTVAREFYFYFKHNALPLDATNMKPKHELTRGGVE